MTARVGRARRADVRAARRGCVVYRELRQAAAHGVRAAVRARRCRARVVSRAGDDSPTLGWVVLAFTCGALRGDGLQSHRRSRDRCANPRTSDARAAERRAVACSEAWLSVVVSHRGVRRLRAWRLNPLCAVSVAARARLGVRLQLHQALHAMVASRARASGMSIAPVGGYLAVTGRVEPSVVDARRAGARGRDVGRRIRRALRAAGRSSSIARSRCTRCRRRSASARAIYIARALHVADDRRVSARRRGDSARTLGVLYYACGVVRRGGDCCIYEHSLVHPGRFLEARRRVLHDERHDQHHAVLLRARRAHSCRCCSWAGRADSMCQPSGRSSSRSPARRARRTRCGCSSAARGAARRVQLIVSSHGLRLAARRKSDVGSVDALRERVGAAAGTRTSRVFDDGDRGAAPASGSALNAGMVICPCSMGTLSAIAPARRGRSSSARPTSRSRSGVRSCSCRARRR